MWIGGLLGLFMTVNGWLFTSFLIRIAGVSTIAIIILIFAFLLVKVWYSVFLLEIYFSGVFGAAGATKLNKKSQKLNYWEFKVNSNEKIFWIVDFIKA